MNWKKYLPIIGIILFIYILIKVNLMNVLEVIGKADPTLVLISLLFLFLVILPIQTFKWYIIAVFQDIKIPFKEAFKINIISNFYAFITPSKIGGVIRAEYLKKYTKDKNIGKGLFNFTIDKVLDISSVIFMAILFSFVFKDKLDLPLGFFTAMFLIFVLLILFFMKKERSKLVLSFFYRKIIPKKMKKQAKLTFNSFYEHIPKKRYLPFFFLLNIVSWISIYFIFYIIGLSLGMDISFIYYLAILPIGTLVAMIPISINGLGTREATLISLFALFNVEASKAFSMSIIAFFIVGILPSIIAWFFIWGRRKLD